MRFRRREPYRWRKGDWFLDKKSKKVRTWPLKLGIILLGGYSLFMTGNEIYRAANEEGYERGINKGYRAGHKAGQESVACPQPWQTSMAAPAIID